MSTPTCYCLPDGLAITGGSSELFFLGGGGGGGVEGKFWRRGPNLPPFSSFSTDLGQFILILLNFDIYVSHYLC